VISAVAGLGEALVSGEVDGEGWSVAGGGHIATGPAVPEVLTGPEVSAIAALARVDGGSIPTLATGTGRWRCCRRFR